jgi:hypothetical protein
MALDLPDIGILVRGALETHFVDLQRCQRAWARRQAEGALDSSGDQAACGALAVAANVATATVRHFFAADHRVSEGPGRRIIGALGLRFETVTLPIRPPLPAEGVSR